MLERLHFKKVGPPPEMKMELAPRLNLITGDNGLGKSILAGRRVVGADTHLGTQPGHPS